MTSDDRALRLLAEANPVPDLRRTEPGSLKLMDLARERRGTDMQTEERTLRGAPEPSRVPSRLRPRWVMAIAAAVMVIAAGAGGWLMRGAGGGETAADADVEERISALIDDWFEALVNEDSQAASSLLTEDARLVSIVSDPGGVPRDELLALVEFGGEGAVRTSDPLIYERSDSYSAVVKMKWGSESNTREHFELFTIVEENGVLKIRYAEVWSTFGWFRTADDQPYQHKTDY